MTSIVAGVVFVQLPTAVGPLGLWGASLVVAWIVRLVSVLALVLGMNMHAQLDEA